MKSTILTVHNYYRQPGGEDVVFEAEAALLQRAGHRVVQYTRHNDAVDERRPVALAMATIWNRAAYRDVVDLVRETKPDVIHVHNTLPLVSPSVYHAARATGVPVVHTVHNYRLFCANGLFYRDGAVCEDCAGKAVPWPAVAHRCYRGSAAASGTITTMLATHRALRTWTRNVDAFVAPTRFCRDRIVASGLPADRVFVKPHFVDPDPGVRSSKGRYGLFVGRLTFEKGIRTLLEALRARRTETEFVIAGDGPLRDEVAAAAAGIRGLTWAGHQPLEEVHRLVAGARFLVVPSLWYETFGRVVVESFAGGTPVLVSDGVAASELVESGRTGFHFRRGDAADLARQMERADAEPERMIAMGGEARREFEAKYSAEGNYAMLCDIYRTARERAA